MFVNPIYRRKLIEKGHLVDRILKGLDDIKRFSSISLCDQQVLCNKCRVVNFISEIRLKFDKDFMDAAVDELWPQLEKIPPIKGMDIRDRKIDECVSNFIDRHLSQIIKACEEVREERRQLLWHSSMTDPRQPGKYYKGEDYREEWASEGKTGYEGCEPVANN